MIAPAANRHPQRLADRHRKLFLSLLPAIVEQARFAFRHRRLEEREEFVAEVVANCWVAFTRLVERRLTEIIYATPLAQYAIKQVRDGRRVGCKSNVRDVSTEYAQRAKRFTVGRLDHFDANKGEWRQLVVEDRHAGPAETAAARIDIGDWLANLPRRTRRIARTLATGETTKNAARKFRVSAARISQTRRELQDGWQSFQGELASC